MKKIIIRVLGLEQSRSEEAATSALRQSRKAKKKETEKSEKPTEGIRKERGGMQRNRELGPGLLKLTTVLPSHACFRQKKGFGTRVFSFLFFFLFFYINSFFFFYVFVYMYICN